MQHPYLYGYDDDGYNGFQVQNGFEGSTTFGMDRVSENLHIENVSFDMAVKWTKWELHIIMFFIIQLICTKTQPDLVRANARAFLLHSGPYSGLDHGMHLTYIASFGVTCCVCCVCVCVCVCVCICIIHKLPLNSIQGWTFGLVRTNARAWGPMLGHEDQC